MFHREKDELLHEYFLMDLGVKWDFDFLSISNFYLL